MPTDATSLPPAADLIPTPTEKAKAGETALSVRLSGNGMKTYRVRYETQLEQEKEGTEIVSASGKGQAMLAAQQRIHPDMRPDEPYFHFEPLSIRPLETPGTFAVHYRTRVGTPRSGVIDIQAASVQEAASKARFAVHPELIPPRCFNAVEIVEINQPTKGQEGGAQG